MCCNEGQPLCNSATTAFYKQWLSQAVHVPDLSSDLVT
jgi:hypothetical protein